MKNKVTLLHNPKCSKSRQTLALLEQAGCDIEVIDYLKNPPSINTLKKIIQLLKISARDIMRQAEEEYITYDLGDSRLTEEQLLTALQQHPRILQRPIVFTENRAIIGRPPEHALEILT